MNFLDSLKMATTMLAANKLRSLLTMLGIVIGNASVIAMVGIGEGAQKLAQEQFKSLGPTVMFVMPGSRKARRSTIDRPKTLVLADAEAIAAQVPTVADVAPEINRRLQASYRNINTTGQLIGTTPNYPVLKNFSVEEGRFFDDTDLKRNNRVVAIGSEIAHRLYGLQNPIGQTLRIKGISFQVIGVMEPKGASMGVNQDEFLLIPITTMTNQMVGRTSPYGIELSWINVLAKDAENIRAAKFQIENLLRLRHNITTQEDDFGVESAKQLLDIVGTVTTGLTILLAAIAGISLVVGGIGVMNIMLVSVTERTQEIGLRKALGATGQDILLQFLIEAVIIAALGGVVGVAFGVSGIGIVDALSPLPAQVSPQVILVSLAISGGIGLFFGVIPAQRAAKLDPIIALRTV
jgi:putative ABC transport system permease protein